MTLKIGRQESHMPVFKASYYNRIVSHGSQALLFNGATGAFIQVAAETTALLSPFLGPERPKTAGCGLDQWHPRRFSEGDLPPSIRPLFGDLIDGGFFVPESFNEQEALRQRYRDGKESTTVYARITTTMDCNYSCYYCFEDKSATRLTRPGCDAILDWMRAQLDQRPYRIVFTDWFGGEPMLNQEPINYLSEKLIGLTEQHALHYASAMTCNGSLWPQDHLGFVRRNRIGKVQFTFDGPPEHHRKRRRHRPGTEASEDTFDAIVKIIDAIKDEVDVVVRINVDPGIDDSVLDLVPLFRERGWLSQASRVSPYLALIGPMNSHCGNLDTARFRDFRSRFGDINREFRRLLAKPDQAAIKPLLPPFPRPLSAPCSAVSSSSVIFGPDGRMYRCVLDVGNAVMAHDSLMPAGHSGQTGRCGSTSCASTSASRPAKPHPYLDYDPVRNARCSKCQYLPVCLGGCPKDQFEKNAFYIEERGAYWENNFDDLLRMHAERMNDVNLARV